MFYLVNENLFEYRAEDNNFAISDKPDSAHYVNHTYYFSPGFEEKRDTKHRPLNKYPFIRIAQYREADKDFDPEDLKHLNIGTRYNKRLHKKTMTLKFMKPTPPATSSTSALIAIPCISTCIDTSKSDPKDFSVTISHTRNVRIIKAKIVHTKGPIYSYHDKDFSAIVYFLVSSVSASPTDISGTFTISSPLIQDGEEIITVGDSELVFKFINQKSNEAVVDGDCK